MDIFNVCAAAVSVTQEKRGRQYRGFASAAFFFLFFFSAVRAGTCALHACNASAGDVYPPLLCRLGYISHRAVCPLFVSRVSYEKNWCYCSLLFGFFFFCCLVLSCRVRFSGVGDAN